MRKSIGLLFPRRKERKNQASTSAEHSSEVFRSSSTSDASNKFPKSRNSVLVLSSTQQQQSRRRSVNKSNFFNFASRRNSTGTAVPSTSEASTAPSTSGADGPLDRSTEGMEHAVVSFADDTLLGPSAESASSSTQQEENQEPSVNSNTPDGTTTPEYPDESEDPFLISSYGDIPVLEQTKLPRGGVSVETSAVGRVQFGIPPETIKDSMKLGLPVPQVYIVPVERFCREIGPALGVNLAEFEFPAYFNFFVYKKRCTLIVDSVDAEDNIRRVFSETLLGPEQFRRDENPITYEPEDFAPNFPKEAIPNFQKELKHFRIMPDGKELVIETILNFLHFEMRSDGHDNLGIPPPYEGTEEVVENSEKEATRQVDLVYGDELVPEEFIVEECVPADAVAVERRETKKPWTYSQARFMGDVSTVWPSNATEEQIKNRSVPRVEIFKMPGGTEYIIHDVNENNIIIGKARISGHVRVSESMSVDGFGGRSILDGANESNEKDLVLDSESSRYINDFFNNPRPPTFHPPSFGVTVLGNSHGFDKSGSVSGYVLWINGRGVMIDPPPYSSATLEREGIRPRTIVGIILTHCHADHDAGAFQKVLTGSPVVVITTPTIYKSFIRKYAALSALSPALLRHSHRFKPAIIGEPLRFQGATFQFTYTLHTIPCVGFRVEWRGRSMVFTGDHFNSPPDMEKLEQSGVLSKSRAADLRNLPLQDCDLLLHEAGAPPIHTPLEVLLKLPEKVKKRLFVVHTSALPPDCELKAAPTGTQGTIRLDKSGMGQDESNRSLTDVGFHQPSVSIFETQYENTWNFRNEYEDSPKAGTGIKSKFNLQSSISSNEPFVSGPLKGRTSVFNHGSNFEAPPLVALRPSSSTDAWYILNLLSAVPFLSSLSYTSTMELLETARVNAYRKRDTIVPADRRNKILCVVWEGTCSEVPVTSNKNGILPTVNESNTSKNRLAVWHAGDWTGPLSLQPDLLLSGESATSSTHDIVAVSSEGVKVITVEFSSLHSILRSGSSLYNKYLERNNLLQTKLDCSFNEQSDTANVDVANEACVHELLNSNSALRKLNAVQKRHLESLAEGPIRFLPGDRLWRAGGPVDRAFIIVSGSASFVLKRRNAGSASVSVDDDKSVVDSNIGQKMQIDAKKVAKELGPLPPTSSDVEPTNLMEPAQVKLPAMSLEKIFKKSGLSSDSQNPVEKLRQGLERRANHVNTNDGTGHSVDLSFGESQDHDSMDTDNDSNLEYVDDIDGSGNGRATRSSVFRRRSSRARKANKVLGRLYNRRAFTGGLVFSRGHFLGDVSKMVDGLLASDLESDKQEDGPTYGFGVQVDGADDTILAELTIHEEGGEQVSHSSTLTAGNDGCVVLVFPKASLIPFLDQYPGVLLSLLGTQVVV